MSGDLYLRWLAVKHFRPFVDQRVAFEPGLNAIVGANARGKTSLIEAIYLCMAATSFRTARVSEMIHHGESWLTVDICYSVRSIERRLRVAWGETEKRVVSDGTHFPHLHAVVGMIPGVVMVPSDLGLVKGAPQLRRDFLDRFISQADPLYFHHLKRFQRALKQRNKLLKIKEKRSIESWEREMALSAVYLTDKRRQMVAELEEQLQVIYPKLGEGGERLALQFLPSLSQSETYGVQLRQMREREYLLGTTLVGPHKDDFAIILSDKEARHFASEGQQRSTVAALKLAEWQVVAKRTGETPLMLVDDFGQSLDPNRQERFLHLLSHLGQVLLTTNTPLPIPAHTITL
ncbi:MAG: DNA replication and repair protein RecF [Chlamydiia bacterium]|nr:DNA replication and repair protein RecF [Chlamydiia bacterium]